MNTRDSSKRSNQRGVGLIEIMVGIIIGMLLILMIFQVYLVTEGQKRTITSSNDAQENASYGLFLLSQELAGAGNGIASSATNSAGGPILAGCAMLRPIPAVIGAGATATDPDTVTAFYGGSGSLSTPAPLLSGANVGSSPPGVYQVAGPLAFSPGDRIAAVQGTNCTLSTINALGVAVAPGTGIATISHTLEATPGNNAAFSYAATTAWLVNLGQRDWGQTRYSVDPTNSTLRTQSLLPVVAATTPVASNVVNLKAQYGLDTDGDGDVDTWQSATGTWSSVNLPLQPSAAAADGKIWFPWQRIQAVRVAIVTRSDKYETDAVTSGPLGMFCSPGPCAVSMTLTPDQQHYRYKVMETIVPLRNAVWNAP